MFFLLKNIRCIGSKRNFVIASSKRFVFEEKQNVDQIAYFECQYGKNKHRHSQCMRRIRYYRLWVRKVVERFLDGAFMVPNAKVKQIFICIFTLLIWRCIDYSDAAMAKHGLEKMGYRVNEKPSPGIGALPAPVPALQQPIIQAPVPALQQSIVPNPSDRPQIEPEDVVKLFDAVSNRSVNEHLNWMVEESYDLMQKILDDPADMPTLIAINTQRVDQCMVTCVCADDLELFANNHEKTQQHGDAAKNGPAYHAAERELCIVGIKYDEGEYAWYRAIYQKELMDSRVQVYCIDYDKIDVVLAKNIRVSSTQ